MDRSPAFPLPADSQEVPEGIGLVYRAAYQSAVTASDAYHATRAAVRREGEVLRLGNRFVRLPRYREIAFLAVGNAAGSQALAVHHALGDSVTQGFLASALPMPEEVPFRSSPLPRTVVGSPAGAEVASKALELARGLGPKDLLTVLLSGGALEALALPPEGGTGGEMAGWLTRVARGPGGSRAAALVAAAVGAGAVDGELAASVPGAEVVTIAIDRGDGAELLGGAPTRRIAAAERTEARAAIGSAGLLGELPPRAIAALAPDPSRPAGLPRTIDRPVQVAQPSDALRGAADALGDRRYRSRLAGLELPGSPPEVARAFCDRLDTWAREERPESGGKDRGLAVLATSTLGVPEGPSEREAARALLASILPRLGYPGSTVGAFVTSGDVGPDATGGRFLAAGGDVAAAVPVPMRPGITDVAVLLLAILPPKPAGAAPAADAAPLR
jgi:glycerate-2-kinase